ncbi:MAG: hypothetical protein NC911_06640 [Candidatus Omnitrophica bacterium]|nr:hypothetical protein [Candidatus Omnitrophota bacterium]
MSWMRGNNRWCLETLMSLVWFFFLAVVATGQGIRKPTFGGSFYPQEAQELREMVNRFLAQASKEPLSGTACSSCRIPVFRKDRRSSLPASQGEKG